MAAVLLKNNATTVLATAILSTATSITVVDGSVFSPVAGGDYFYATIQSTSSTFEVVKVTAVSGNALTIVRAQEGTVAIPFAANSSITQRVTAQTIADHLVTTGVLATGGTTARTIPAHFADTVSVADFGADETGVVESSTAVLAAINSGATRVTAKGTVKIGSTVTIPNGVKFIAPGATFKPSANVDVFRLHGGAQLVGYPTIDVTAQVGWNKACVLLDGDSETVSGQQFRMHEPTVVRVHCEGLQTGSGNGDAIHYKTTDGASNSWIMGTDVEAYVSGFDNPVHITRAGTDAIKVFINGNRINVNHTYGLRSIYMESTNGDNINSNWITMLGQSRQQNDQTATPIVLKGNYNTVRIIQFDWLGGAGGTLDVLDLASQSIGTFIDINATDPTLIQNNSTSRSNTIHNPLSAEGWKFGDISAIVSGSNIRCNSPMRFANGSTFGLGFVDAAGTGEWQWGFADSSDNLTLRSNVTAASRVVLNANNSTGRIDFRINNANAAFVDSSLVLNGLASIRAHQATAIPAGGTAGAGFTLSSTANFGVFFGSGAPSLSAAKGSLYLRSDGSGTTDRMYVNTNGGTTWTAVTTVA